MPDRGSSQRSKLHLNLGAGVSVLVIQLKTWEATVWMEGGEEDGEGKKHSGGWPGPGQTPWRAVHSIHPALPAPPGKCCFQPTEEASYSLVFAFFMFKRFCQLQNFWVFFFSF